MAGMLVLGLILLLVTIFTSVALFTLWYADNAFKKDKEHAEALK